MTSAIKIRVLVGLAMASSLASVLLGYLLMGHFVMATLTYAGMLGPLPRGGWLTTVKYLAHSWWIVLLIGWAALVLVLAWAALRLAARDPNMRNRGASAGIARRFAIGGLIAGVVDLVLVGTLIYIGRVWIWWY